MIDTNSCEIVGRIGSLRVFSTMNMTKQEGTKNIPNPNRRWWFQFWIQKTIEVPNMVPMTNVIVDHLNNAIYIHPAVLDELKKLDGFHLV